VLWSILSVGFVTAISLAVYVLYCVGLRVELAIFWNLLRYSTPIGFIGVAMFVMHSGDRFILERYTTLSAIGVYALAYKVGMLIAVLAEAFQNYWSAQVYSLIKRPDREYVLSEVFFYLALAVCTCTVLIMAFTPPAITIMTSSDYHGASMLVPLILLAYAVRVGGDFFRSLIYADGKPAVDMVLTFIAAGICAASYFLLIPRWTVWGAAVATVIAFWANAIFAGVYSRRLHAFPFKRKRLFKMTVATVVVVSVFIITESDSVARQAVMALLLPTLYMLLLTATRFWTERELLFARGLFRRVVAIAGRYGLTGANTK
jgi:O-antigen/teichoic acid export membrane protein